MRPTAGVCTKMLPSRNECTTSAASSRNGTWPGCCPAPCGAFVVHVAVLDALREHFQQQLPKKARQHPVAHPRRLARQ